jgi:hypothetical protein
VTEQDAKRDFVRMRWDLVPRWWSKPLNIALAVFSDVAEIAGKPIELVARALPVLMLEEDLSALRAAIQTLEHPSLAVRLGRGCINGLGCGLA